LEPANSSLQILFHQLAANPLSFQALRNLARDTTASKRIYDRVAFVGQHPNKIFRKLGRIASRMRFDPNLFAIA
jgi:hypothetical protein